jgi:hypothetical protein
LFNIRTSSSQSVEPMAVMDPDMHTRLPLNGVNVTVDVTVVVGVVTSHTAVEPYATYATSIRFSVSTATVQPAASIKNPPKPQLTSSATPSGPRYSRITSFTAVATASQSPVTCSPCPRLGSELMTAHSIVSTTLPQSERIWFSSPRWYGQSRPNSTVINAGEPVVHTSGGS